MPNVLIVNTPGPQGAVGPQRSVYAKRSDYSGSYSYCGYAESGSLTSSTVWTITRITVFGNGVVTTASASAVSWDNRYNNNYV
jgi:hypothetical protein